MNVRLNSRVVVLYSCQELLEIDMDGNFKTCKMCKIPPYLIFGS